MGEKRQQEKEKSKTPASLSKLLFYFATFLVLHLRVVVFLLLLQNGLNKYRLVTRHCGVKVKLLVGAGMGNV